MQLTPASGAVVPGTKSSRVRLSWQLLFWSIALVQRRNCTTVQQLNVVRRHTEFHEVELKCQYVKCIGNCNVSKKLESCCNFAFTISVELEAFNMQTAYITYMRILQLYSDNFQNKHFCVGQCTQSQRHVFTNLLLKSCSNKFRLNMLRCCLCEIFGSRDFYSRREKNFNSC